MKQYIFLVISAFVLTGCDKEPSNVQEIFLPTEEAVYSAFDMSIFRGLSPDMTYEDMINMLGKPNDFYDYAGEDIDFHNPVYYDKEGKIEVMWCETSPAWEKLYIITYFPFYNVIYYISDFVSDPDQLGIDQTNKHFAVYVDNVQYFDVYHDHGEIREICYKKKAR